MFFIHGENSNGCSEDKCITMAKKRSQIRETTSKSKDLEQIVENQSNATQFGSMDIWMKCALKLVR
jgi:hypothetical protein